jgi:diguanylate cyclase (GGDEF)-like protein
MPLEAPSPAPAAVRARLARTGAVVVAGSVLASGLFTHASFRLFGEIDYAGAMVFAVLIPLVVASLAFAWIAALTLRLEASRRELERLAHQDPLTGLANRRAAFARLDGWATAAAPGLALAIADIDFFKRVNDKLGHDGGDASLVHFAAMLRRLVPEAWLVARLGGEEFLLAARGIDEAAFTARIEALRRAIAETPLITPAGPQSLTASFGLAALREGESVGALITRADNALYAAKQAGRNRTQTAA